MIKIKIMLENSIFDLYRSQLFECSSCGKVAEHLLSSASKPRTQLEVSSAKQYILENRQCWDKDTRQDKFQIHPQAVGCTDMCLNWCAILCFCVVAVKYRGADKSLARPGRKQATATEDSEFHISHL